MGAPEAKTSWTTSAGIPRADRTPATSRSFRWLCYRTSLSQPPAALGALGHQRPLKTHRMRYTAYLPATSSVVSSPNAPRMAWQRHGPKAGSPVAGLETLQAVVTPIRSGLLPSKAARRVGLGRSTLDRELALMPDALQQPYTTAEPPAPSQQGATGPTAVRPVSVRNCNHPHLGGCCTITDRNKFSQDMGHFLLARHYMLGGAQPEKHLATGSWDRNHRSAVPKLIATSLRAWAHNQRD